MAEGNRLPAKGPFRADQVSDGDRYEISSGHPLYCAPSAPRHGAPHALGAGVLIFDPAVTEAGIDTGHRLDDDTLRAPDISIGGVPSDADGWAPGAPPLAVEYASTGQNENDLQSKIAELLGCGCRAVWVVRLVGRKRVDV